MSEETVNFRYVREFGASFLYFAAFFFAVWSTVKASGEGFEAIKASIGLLALGLLFLVIAVMVSIVVKPFSDVFQPPRTFVWWMTLPVIVVEWGFGFILMGHGPLIAVLSMVLGLNLITLALVWVSMGVAINMWGRKTN